MNRTHVIKNLLSPCDIKGIAAQYQAAPAQWSNSVRDWGRREARLLVQLAADEEDWHVPQNIGQDYRLVWAGGDVVTERCVLVAGQPYKTADDMRSYLARRGHLLISTDFNAPAWWDEQTNLLFRYAHDLHHCATADCNFVLDGEICAFTKFAAYIPQLVVENRVLGEYPTEIIKALYGLLWGEIVGQVCFLREYHDYPEQKEVVYDAPADLDLIRRALDVYGVEHLL